MYRIGFAGAWCGLTLAQASVLHNILQPFGAGHWFHHGDNLGGDEEAHEIATNLKFKTAIHPPHVVTSRAFCVADSRLPQKSSMIRMQDVVDKSNFFLGFPDGPVEELRSEVWQTIRYAHKRGKKMVVINPRGEPID